ncbi:hypothetical protein TWF730_010243 [Orbilia blumenaviensis]|uniref:Uncharacterized protein n=1 Tax=Orbilia blumenaviensis TaxID=1796055 RepID=A0AAV9UQ73_9PEZI
MAPFPQTKPPIDEGANLLTKDDTTEKSLALVALVFAVIAFLTAFFQALLQYLTSNQRDKCLRGAIGEWSKFTKTRWDFSNWRIDIKYARLNFEPNGLVAAREKHGEAFRSWTMGNIPELRGGICSLNNYERRSRIDSLFWCIEDRGKIYLGDNKQPVTFWDLRMRAKLSWLAFWIAKRKSGLAPFARAGWCNLLTALSVGPESDVVSSYEKADIIPSGIDVSIQRMPLFDLCLLCYLANIKEIKISEKENNFNGQNRYVNMCTQEIPGLGKFVTFDGDFQSLKGELDIADTSQLVSVSNMAQGGLLGNTFSPSITFFDENAFLLGTVQEWNQDTWNTYRNEHRDNLYDTIAGLTPQLAKKERAKNTAKTSLIYQRDEFDVHFKRHLSEKWTQQPSLWTDTWKEILDSCNPTIVKYLAIMPFNGIWTAIPRRLFYEPYGPFVADRRKAWTEICKASKDQVARFIPDLRENCGIEKDLIYGDIPFLRKTSDFCLTDSKIETVPGNFTWAWFPNRPVLGQWGSDACIQALKTDERDIFFPEVVIKLLDGSLPTIDSATEYIRISSGARRQYYTIESAILLSLLLVDGRLQAIWSLLEDDGGAFSTLQEKLGKGVQLPLNKDQLGLIETAARFEPLIADFTALWFEIGNRVDLLGDPDRLLETATQVLGEWESDSSPCIRPFKPRSRPFLSNAETVVVVGGASYNYVSLDAKKKPTSAKKHPDEYKTPKGLRSRKELVEWARSRDNSGTERLQHINKILILLQLRIFLMDLSYCCHSDSTDACLTKTGKTIAVRMI